MLRPDGDPIPRRPFTASVHGSGSGDGALHVARVVAADAPGRATGTLTATWTEHPEPVVLAWLRLTPICAGSVRGWRPGCRPPPRGGAA